MYCQKGGPPWEALNVVELAMANELKPIRFRDESAVTAHEAAYVIGHRIEADIYPVDHWDELKSKSGKRYSESERQRDCRRWVHRIGDVTPELLRELEERIAMERIKAERWLLDHPTTTLVAGGKGTTLDEANKTAMRLAKQDRAFVRGGAREWAAAIRMATGKTCSIPTVTNTPLWKATMKATGRGRSKGKIPKAVALTDNMESVVGQGERHEVLEGLIAQQKTDYEPSPLEDTPPAKRRKTKQYKRL
jgi:hypothetical protein